MRFVIGLVVLTLALGGCAIKAPGSRTFNFGPDGATVTSETVETSSSDQVELEKEKTRQVCYRQQSAKKAKIEQLAESQPLVYALIAQTDSINNAVSLAVTRKPYDPCPSSTNRSDVEIADAAMYTSIYNGAFNLAGKVAMIWGGVEIAGDLFSALKKTGGYNLTATGEGSSINVTDAFKTSTIGNGSTAGAILSNPVDQTAEPFIMEPFVIGEPAPVPAP